MNSNTGRPTTCFGGSTAPAHGGAGLPKHCLREALRALGLRAGVVRTGPQGWVFSVQTPVPPWPQPLLTEAGSDTSSPPPARTRLFGLGSPGALRPLAPNPFQAQVRACSLFLRVKNCHRFSLAYLSLLTSWFDSVPGPMTSSH